jgi:Dynamin family
MNSLLLGHLQTAAKLLEIGSESLLAKDLATIVDRSSRTSYQIAVFGPFNHGKSTLLNAILGSKTLPIDLIPTTGAAIKVVYGAEIGTAITLTSGEVIRAAGTEILSQFAILDDDRRMRNDVAAIEVSYPHPFLEMGVELIDLPGTNDRDEQDRFVRERLLAADLVVNVLDVRKLLTLGEREHLRDWLESRGIQTVVFVANFTNMLEPEEQREVQHRLRFVAESFRSTLPSGISNLYRVDALPALRARLKGDDGTLHTSGLSAFISALQAIVTHQKSELTEVRQPQLQAIGQQLRGLLEAQVSELTVEINARSAKADRELALKQQAQQLIKKGWESGLQELEQWLYLPNLIAFYQTSLAAATQQAIFPQWETANVAPKLQQLQKEINDCVNQATDFFGLAPVEPLILSLPEPPEVLLSSALPSPEPPKTSNSDGITPTAIATGLGWLVGGPVGAVVVGGASVLVNQLDPLGRQDRKTTKNNEVAEAWAAYQDAAADYLFRLNTCNATVLSDYRSRAIAAINAEITSEHSIETDRQQRLLELSECLTNLS